MQSTERKKRLPLPAAPGVAAFTALALAYPAIADLRHSAIFFGMAVGIVIAAFGQSGTDGGSNLRADGARRRRPSARA